MQHRMRESILCMLSHLTTYKSHNFWYRLSHRTIQLMNRIAPLNAPICYPLGTDHAALHQLVHTVQDANNINGMC
jgi:hypothetical protein